MISNISEKQEELRLEQFLFVHFILKKITEVPRISSKVRRNERQCIEGT